MYRATEKGWGNVSENKNKIEQDGKIQVQFPVKSIVFIEEFYGRTIINLKYKDLRIILKSQKSQ